jgi:lipoprotein-releasing system ATP-binding protein
MMLKLDKISKSFLHRGVVLDNLDLEINPGESVSIMGPSGSGKTTLLNIIALLDKPDSGNILFKDEPVSDYTPDQSSIYRNKNLGFVFQDHHMLPYLTIFDNIMLPVLAERHLGYELTVIERYVTGLMEKTGIMSISSKYPFQVSGGEAQRASVIRAMVNKPSFILADEPTGSLDSANSEILAGMLLDMNRNTGTALIIATHSHSLAAKMGRQLQLKDGKLILPEVA